MDKETYDGSTWDLSILEMGKRVNRGKITVGQVNRQEQVNG